MESHMDALLQSQRKSNRKSDRIGNALGTMFPIADISVENIQIKSNIVRLLASKI